MQNTSEQEYSYLDKRANYIIGNTLQNKNVNVDEDSASKMKDEKNALTSFTIVEEEWLTKHCAENKHSVNCF